MHNNYRLSAQMEKININMRCIEIDFYTRIDVSATEININMRCIEMLQSQEFPRVL